MGKDQRGKRDAFNHGWTSILKGEDHILKFKNHQRHTTAVRQKSNVLMVPSRALHFPPTSLQASRPHLTVPHPCWPPLSTTNAPGFPLHPMWSAPSTWLPPAYHSDHSWESVPFNTLPKVRFWRMHYLFFHFLGFLKEKNKRPLPRSCTRSDPGLSCSLWKCSCSGQHPADSSPSVNLK